MTTEQTEQGFTEFKFRMPNELHERLRDLVGARGGRPMAREVVRRLQASFVIEDLLQAIDADKRAEIEDALRAEVDAQTDEQGAAIVEEPEAA